ncbi:MAG: hypothetical protein R2883_03130 [Caldisericia bacterium]
MEILSTLARERLTAVRPKTLGSAMRVDGVKFLDIEALTQYVSMKHLNENHKLKYWIIDS